MIITFTLHTNNLATTFPGLHNNHVELLELKASEDKVGCPPFLFTKISVLEAKKRNENLVCFGDGLG